MQFVHTLCAILALIIYKALAESCENGKEILMSGPVSDQDMETIVNIHNKYRRMVARGELDGQPRATNMLEMKYNDELGELAHQVSLQCEMEHDNPSSSNFESVGQNLYSSSSDSDSTPNWEEAIESWVNEYTNYNFGEDSSFSVAAHYTQVVWANSEYVGCDYIMYDEDGSQVKLYTCNYGPGGNYVGENPYETDGGDECSDLC